MDVSGNVILLLKMLNNNIKIFDTNIDNFPEDAFFPDDTRDRAMHLNLSGYKFLLKHRNSVKYSLLSDDLYPKVISTKSYLNENLKDKLFKKSFFLKKFRMLRNESFQFLKSNEDEFYYIKLFYNKPDILHDFRYKIKESIITKYAAEERT
jgi:hypothetical protein